VISAVAAGAAGAVMEMGDATKRFLFRLARVERIVCAHAALDAEALGKNDTSRFDEGRRNGNLE
jgi:hypothetical protein